MMGCIWSLGKKGHCIVPGLKFGRPEKPCPGAHENLDPCSCSVVEVEVPEENFFLCGSKVVVCGGYEISECCGG